MKVLLENVLIEFEHNLACLYFDSKGRVMKQLKEIFPRISRGNDVNEFIRIYSEDKSMVAKIAPEGSGVFLNLDVEDSEKQDTILAEYISSFLKVYNEVGSIFEIKEKIKALSIRLQFTVEFDNNESFERFKMDKVISQKVYEFFPGSINDFRCIFENEIDGVKNIVDINLDDDSLEDNDKTDNNTISVTIQKNYPQSHLSQDMNELISSTIKEFEALLMNYISKC